MRVGGRSDPGDATVAMTDARARVARHERPAIDEAGLVAARAADRILAGVRERGLTRWVEYFDPLPDRLRDDPVADLRRTVVRARAAFGPKDSIRDALPEELTEPFLDALDRLLRELNRREAAGG
jgi:hypothetical protein